MMDERYAFEEFSIESDQPGPCLLVFGGVHGNEVCGTLALRRLQDEYTAGRLRLLRGKVIGVPCVNPFACKQGVRCIDEDLNRIFIPGREVRSYESSLVEHLLSLISQCDLLLDLHSVECESEPFVFQDYQDRESVAFQEALGVGLIATGWPGIMRSAGKSLRADTSAAANGMGKANAVVECGTKGTVAARENAFSIICSALRYLEMLPGAPPSPRKDLRYVHLTEAVFLPPRSTFARDCRHLKHVEPGTLLATAPGGKEFRATVPGTVFLPFSATLAREGSYYFAADPEAS